MEQDEVEVLSEQAAVEAIREVYTLSMGLRNDFRRVEDSYRAADQRLRESVVSQDSHHGQIVDTLLDSQDALLETNEGQVFDAFQQQLTRSLELEKMKQQIRSLTDRPQIHKALNREQRSELRWLVMRLVDERLLFLPQINANWLKSTFIKSSISAGMPIRNGISSSLPV